LARLTRGIAQSRLFTTALPPKTTAPTAKVSACGAFS
jgi:hypothetical protein